MALATTVGACAGWWPPGGREDAGVALDELLAAYMGKYVLITLTYYDEDGEVVTQQEVHGIIIKADHARGKYGSAGLFAGGESVSLAGVAATVAARPELPMSTLTVTGTTIAGQPDTGDLVFVMNVDNSVLFSDPNESTSFFYKGSAKFSVPAGNYFALGLFFDISGASRLVALPQFAVGGTTSVALAEAAATSAVSFATPRPARLQDAMITLNRVPAAGPAASFGLDNGTSPLWINQTTSAPSAGGLDIATNGSLVSPAAASPHYEYDLLYGSTGGEILSQHHVVTAASLATVDERFYQGRV